MWDWHSRRVLAMQEVRCAVPVNHGMPISFTASADMDLIRKRLKEAEAMAQGVAR